MTVTEKRMAWGDFTINLKPDTPRQIIQKLNDSWYGLIRVYGQRVSTSAVGSAPGLFTGVMLDRTNRFEIGGASGTWYLGEASDGTSTEETGPLSVTTMTHNGSTSGSMQDWVGTVLATTVCGLFPIYLGGPGSGTKYAGSFTRKTAKTIFDSWVCPRFGVEYRVNPDLTIDFGYTADLYPLPAQIPLAVKRGGRDPNVIGLNSPQLSLEQSVRDRTSRAITVISSPSTYQAVSAGTWPYKNPQGDPLNWTRQVGGTSSSQATVPLANAEALANSNAVLADSLRSSRSIKVQSREYAITQRVGPGDYIYVYDLDEGLYDQTNAIQFRGELIYPVLLRVEEVVWPLEPGMSVHLDNRHQGGGLDVTDLTRYVDFDSDGSETTVVVGAPPATLGKTIRRKK